MKGILFKPWKTDWIREHPEIEIQTRRVIKPQPVWLTEAWYWKHPRYDNGDGVHYFHSFEISPSLLDAMIPCAKYQVGEVLYIKEAWRITSISDDFEELFINYGDGFENWKAVPDDLATYYYNHYFKAKRRPSTLFMPAWAARTFVTVLKVEAEKLSLPLPPDVLEAEGGERALELLSKIDGQWVFAYTLKGRDK